MKTWLISLAVALASCAQPTPAPPTPALSAADEAALAKLAASLHAGSGSAAAASSAAPAADDSGNLAAPFAAEWLPTVAPGVVCALWTGRGTKTPAGVDSVKCRQPGGTRIFYCSAPADKKPSCEVSADWTPADGKPKPAEAEASADSAAKGGKP
jgi:hypothetical protein